MKLQSKKNMPEKSKEKNPKTKVMKTFTMFIKRNYIKRFPNVCCQIQKKGKSKRTNI